MTKQTVYLYNSMNNNNILNRFVTNSDDDRHITCYTNLLEVAT